MQVACPIGYRAGWDIAQRGTRGCHAFDTAAAHSHTKRTCGWASRAELTTHAVVPALVEACTAEHTMPMESGARDRLLCSDAVCATAAAAVTTICEGITMARDKPVVAASM
jgi:hypothetical protein